jgi:hypothetical protein
MGEMADDIADGFVCSHCGVYFEHSHGYPVLCHGCFDTETKKERAGLPRATEPELDDEDDE